MHIRTNSQSELIKKFSKKTSKKFTPANYLEYRVVVEVSCFRHLTIQHTYDYSDDDDDDDDDDLLKDYNKGFKNTTTLKKIYTITTQNLKYMKDPNHINK